MKPTLGLRIGTSLTMTPALQQAIRMLQLSSLDLQTEIQEALDSNLMLEQPEDFADAPDAPAPDAPAAEQGDDAQGEPAAEADTIPEDTGLDFEWDDVYSGSSTDPAAQQALYEYRQASLSAAPDLCQHLLEQARLLDLEPAQSDAAAYIIDSIDERGYLCDWHELRMRIGEQTGLGDDEADAVLRLIQTFDPAGVAARDLVECLLLQLDQHDGEPATVALARQLVATELEALAGPDTAKLARRLEVPAAAVAAALDLIRGLAPHPGTPYSEARTDYIAPDVFVTCHEGRWVASLNPEIAPKLRINPIYQALVQRADTSPDQQLMRQHLQEARYFLNSLKSRNDTLLRVAQAIVDQQRAFLEYGAEAMKPMVLRDIAESLGIHESTVSRATAHKYMHTPRGLFELKFFFSSSVQTTEGGSCSATAIQAMIRRLVGEENPARPLSDAKLTQLLLDEGVRVARRTVAKYREGLGIPPSHERRVTA